MKPTLMIFALVAICILSAQDIEQPMKLDAEMTQGDVSITCARLDLSSWGGPFRFSPPQFRCSVVTKAKDTTAFEVSLQTRDGAGKTTSHTTRTAAVAQYSLVVFPTKDTVLTSVLVSEIKGVVRFDSSTE